MMCLVYENKKNLKGKNVLITEILTAKSVSLLKEAQGKQSQEMFGPLIFVSYIKKTTEYFFYKKRLVRSIETLL